MANGFKSNVTNPRRFVDPVMRFFVLIQACDSLDCDSSTPFISYLISSYSLVGLCGSCST